MSYAQLTSQVQNLVNTNATLVSEVTRVRDAAMGLVRLYPSISEGRNASNVGEYFSVPGEGAFLRLYQKTSTSEQLLIAEYPTHQALQDFLNGFGSAASADVQSNPADATPGKVLKTGASPTVLSFDPLRKAVESESGGRQTVIYTAKNQPCIMYVLPRFNMEDIPGWNAGTGTHPAFVFNGTAVSEIFVGAYLASESNGEAISQAQQVPRVSRNYDQARALCQSNGAGWDLMSVWDWAAIALWCSANGYEPRGNTNHGRHHNNRWETGVRVDGGAPGTSIGTSNTLTGSGPNSWRHDNSPAGISDLVGNVGEWLSGFKMVDARAYIALDNAIPTENLYFDTGFDMPATSSTNWSGLTKNAPDILKQALIMPKGYADPSGSMWTNLSGERLSCRGGSRSNSGFAGLAALHLNLARSVSYSDIGFRPRFRNL